MFTLNKWFPVIVSTSSDTSTECGICRVSLDKDCAKCTTTIPYTPNKCQKSSSKNCSHIFHTHCTEIWPNKTCPFDMTQWA